MAGLPRPFTPHMSCLTRAALAQHALGDRTADEAAVIDTQRPCLAEQAVDDRIVGVAGLPNTDGGRGCGEGSDRAGRTDSPGAWVSADFIVGKSANPMRVRRDG